MQYLASVLAVASLAGTTLASPVAERSTAEPSKFTALALRSGSPIHFVPLTVENLAIVLSSQKPTTYCPTETVESCPAGDSTVFDVYNGYASLNVAVPGGQQLYVTKEGRLSVTQAHSAALPDGAYSEGFIYTPGQAGEVGSFGFTGGEATGFFACKADGSDSYEVYADVKTAQLPEDCSGFEAGTATYPETEPAAWQYA